MNDVARKLLKEGDLPEDRTGVVYPEEGLKRNSWYVVLVSYGPHNPLFSSLFYAGLCDDGDTEPGNYAGLCNPSTHKEWENWSQGKPRYMQVGRCLGPLLEGEDFETELEEGGENSPLSLS